MCISMAKRLMIRKKLFSLTHSFYTRLHRNFLPQHLHGIHTYHTTTVSHHHSTLLTLNTQPTRKFKRYVDSYLLLIKHFLLVWKIFWFLGILWFDHILCAVILSEFEMRDRIELSGYPLEVISKCKTFRRSNCSSRWHATDGDVYYVETSCAYINCGERRKGLFGLLFRNIYTIIWNYAHTS